MNPGDELAGRYELIELIGVGGMGEVWRGKQSALGRAVAIKVLHASLQDSQGGSSTGGGGAEQRFRREAELVAKVEHRNVVDIIDFGTSADVQFLVMPLLAGETLGQRMRRTPAPDLLEIVSLMRAVLSGLGAIHDAGIVHRDLKPANVFLVRDADGVVPKLLDFGISREQRAAPSGTALTQEGIMMGTPQYMAPEQFESARSVDARADVFSAGAILYEALAGRPPYEGDDPFAVYRKILAGEGRRLDDVRSDLPPALCDLVHTALATSADQRFPSARAMREALDALVSGGSLQGVSAADFPTLDQRKVRGGMSEAPTAPVTAAPVTAAAAEIAHPGREAQHSIPLPQAVPAPAVSSRKWLFVAAGIVAALSMLGGVFFFVRGGQAPAAPVLAGAGSSEEVEEEPASSWLRFAAADDLEELVIRWGRLGAGERALGLRLGRTGETWGLLADELDAEEVARLASALETEAESIAAPEGLLTPRLMATKVRLNIRRAAERQSPTQRVLPHDTLVVALHGELDGSASILEGEGAMSFVVSSEDASGWGFSRFLEAKGECLPAPRAFMETREALRESFTASLTHGLVGGVEREVYLTAGIDRARGRSRVAVFERRGQCQLGPLVSRHAIDGVIDEYFFTEGDGETLLVASWHLGTRAPADGAREWAAWRLEGDSRVWNHRGRTGATMNEDERGTVSGTRDRLLARREGYVLSTRDRGSARVWFRYEGGRVVEAEAPPRR